MDRVSFFGNKRKLTPNIDKLIKNSLVFDNCITNSPWTLPSHANFFTGLYSSEHKVTSVGSSLDPKIPTLAEILKNLGYLTIGLTQNIFISKFFGLSKGFDIFYSNYEEKVSPNPFVYKIHRTIARNIDNIENFSPLLSSILKGIYNKIVITLNQSMLSKSDKINLEYFIKEDSINDINNLEDSLKRNKDKQPFYLFINFMDTHYPYAPPKEYLEKYNINNQDFELIKNFYLNTLDVFTALNLGIRPFLEKEKNSLNKFYDSSVDFLDMIVSKLLEALERLEILEDTILIIISDHGEFLGNKNFWTHHYSVYEELLQVPVIIYNKNMFKNNIISNQVELKNLYHTIISMALHNGEKNNQIISYNEKLSYLYHMENNNYPKYIYGEYLIPRDLYRYGLKYSKNAPNAKYLGNIRFLRTSEMKFIHFGMGKNEIYEIKSDPKEENNLIGEKSKIAKEMEKRMKDIIKTFKRGESVVSIHKKREEKIIREAVHKVIKDKLVL
jgi:arylsulfatase A-like enzyme